MFVDFYDYENQKHKDQNLDLALKTTIRYKLTILINNFSDFLNSIEWQTELLACDSIWSVMFIELFINLDL